ncbi:MAG: adenylate/guanylate cyclase domain-containing protein [Candidatus Lambdaproteobacteria bacterium]|nr:adenylate/guanylate cyclase domain-containing protein [Candidatus Lambdaproteobacteria bacterium]
MLVEQLAGDEGTGRDPQWLGAIGHILAASVQIAEPFMAAAAALGVVAFPLFHVIWRFVFPQPYESLALRLIGSALCLPIVVKDYWPQRLVKYLPIYWQVTILYTLPFHFSYLALANEMNQVWVLSTVAGVFLLTFFVEWRAAIALFAIGAGAAWFLYAATDDTPVTLAFYLQYVVIFLFPLTFGSFINQKLQKYRELQSRFEKRLRHITNSNAKMMHDQNQLLSRFLSNSIVNRLWQSQREHGLEHAIATITRQEKRFCGIMQADIRNFTKMFGHESEMEVAQVIRHCFTEITEVGQDLAVIKPVGDSIFVYCDDLNGGRVNAVHDILALAVFFVHSVERINRLVGGQGATPLNFGIAVHAGEAIYGNLASDTLIDPTIIGIHVNETARLEELTKVPALAKIIGNNAIILSQEIAELGRNFFPREALIPIDLEAMGIRVRDFGAVHRVFALDNAAARAYFGRAMEHIDSRRRGQPVTTGHMEVNAYHGVSYYYEMQGMGPNMSWVMLIDVSGIPPRAIHQFAQHAMQDLDYEINHANGPWLVASTARHAGEYDETDVEARIFRIIEGLQQARPH